MRTLEGDQVLVRVFFGDADKWHHQPLATALLERLRREGFAGATVLHGVAGFGAASVIHTAHLVDLSGDLPVILEVVDTEDQVGKLMPILDEMLTGGALVTTEKVHVRRYSSGQKRRTTPPPG
jgi:PII-like signaling protein